MQRFVVYRRVSTEGQGKSGLGLEAQDRDIKIFVEAYSPDADIIGSFTDVESGQNGDRPELVKAIALARMCRYPRARSSSASTENLNLTIKQ